MPMINADGCRLRVEVEGPAGAPALVFSNSLGANLHMWDQQAQALSQDFRIVRYDQRGHGKSEAPKGPYTVDRLGKDVIAILDHLAIRRAHFCGLSMGGMTGMWLGRFAGERLHKLVLSNTSARSGDPISWNTRIRTVLDKGMKPLIDGTIERWFSKSFRRDNNTQTIEAVRKMLLATPAYGYAGCSAALRDTDQRWGIQAITTPTLVITGTLDPSTQNGESELIAGRIKGSQLIAFDTAHLSNLEKPQDYTGALKKFLA